MPAAILFVASFALYASHRSQWLDDWDSVNFAKALVRFSVADQQPHPPGYPAYVFLGRVIDVFAHDQVVALTLLSALTGAAGVAAFYLLAADMGIGWAALPLAVMPLWWLNSEMALTDVPGLAFAIGSVWLLRRAACKESSQAWLIAGAALAGLGAGVRPQTAVVPLAVMLVQTIPELIRGRRQSMLLWGADAFVVACLTWAVPLAVSLWQEPEPLRPFQVQVQYVRLADSLVGGQPLTASRLESRLEDFGSILSAYSGGPMIGGIVAFGLIIGAAVALGWLARQELAARLGALWLVSYGTVMLLVMQPGDPRKALPVVPALLLLYGAGLARLGGRRTVIVGLLALTGWFALKGSQLVSELDRVPPPPEQAAMYIASQFDPRETIIVSDTSANHMLYRMPQFESFGLDFISDFELRREIAALPARNVIILDRWQRPAGIPQDFRPADARLFERDPLVLPKAARVPVTLWERAPGV